MNSIDERYKKALIEEYESYLGAGRTADAKQVARALKDQYDYDVAKSDDGASEKATPERADVEKPPEAAVEPQPRRGGRPKLPRDDKGNIVRDSKD